MGSGRGGRFGFFLRGRRLRAGTRRLAGAWARRLAVRDRRQTFWLRVTQRLGLAHCGMLALWTHPGPRGQSALAVEPTNTATLLWRPLLCDTGLLILSLQHHTDLPIFHLTFKLCLWKVNNLINRFVGSNKFGLCGQFNNETTSLVNCLSARSVCSFSMKRTPECINVGIKYWNCHWTFNLNIN